MRSLGPVYLDEIEHFHARYRIDRVLVYRTTNTIAVGIDRVTHDPVIIKSAFNQGQYKLKEVNLLRKLRNVPGVVELLDHFHTQERVHLLVTRKFGQTSLRRHLKIKRGLTENEAKNLILQIVDTVQECAKQNIFHTRLDPDNLVLDTRRWQVQLRNFDAATYIRIDGLSSSYKKLCYERAPPEYHTPGHYYWDTLTVWFIGTLLYEMLFSQTPFQSAYDIINKPCFPQKPNPLSRQAQLFIEACLKKQEKDRMSWKHVLHHPWITNTF